MRNLVIFALIFVPIAALIAYVYTKVVHKVAPKPPEPEIPTRLAELQALKAELEAKLEDYDHIKETKALRQRLNEVNTNIEALNNV